VQMRIPRWTPRRQPVRRTTLAWAPREISSPNENSSARSLAGWMVTGPSAQEQHARVGDMLSFSSIQVKRSGTADSTNVVKFTLFLMFLLYIARKVAYHGGANISEKIASVPDLSARPRQF